MAIISPTESLVGLSKSAVGGQRTETAQAGEAIARGQVYYKDSLQSNKAYLAKCDDTTKRAAAGIAVTATDANGYFLGITSGQYAVGAAVTIPNDYVLSATAGSICLRSDLSTGDFLVSLFNATTANEGVVDINNTGIQVP